MLRSGVLASTLTGPNPVPLPQGVVVVPGAKVLAKVTAPGAKKFLQLAATEQEPKSTDEPRKPKDGGKVLLLSLAAVGGVVGAGLLCLRRRRQRIQAVAGENQRMSVAMEQGQAAVLETELARQGKAGAASSSSGWQMSVDTPPPPPSIPLPGSFIGGGASFAASKQPASKVDRAPATGAKKASTDDSVAKARKTLVNLQAMERSTDPYAYEDAKAAADEDDMEAKFAVRTSIYEAMAEFDEVKEHFEKEAAAKKLAAQDCEWMFGDTGGMFGSESATLNPLRWSGSLSIEEGIKELKNALKLGSRPILVKVPSGFATMEKKFDTTQAAIDHLKSFMPDDLKSSGWAMNDEVPKPRVSLAAVTVSNFAASAKAEESEAAPAKKRGSAIMTTESQTSLASARKSLAASLHG